MAPFFSARRVAHDEPEPAPLDSGAAGLDRPATTSWPATRFSVDPASSPVLMAAFAWSSWRDADARHAG